MEAIILAGGLGTRLSNVVKNTPKCLAPIAGKPFLHWLVLQLKKGGITHFIFSVGHLKEQIISWAATNLNKNEYKICEEQTPLGTGGGIQKALQFCTNKNIFAVNGDTFYNIDFKTMLAWHNKNNALCTLALKPMLNFNRYGTVTTTKNTIITKFSEKTNKTKGLINGGVYCINASKFLALVMPYQFSFETDFLQPQALQNSLYSFIDDGYFIDIGIPEDYDIANKYFTEK